MYDFSPQKEMMKAALYILEKHNIAGVSALGGGTALAAYYWDHRYSTDIDIFIHSKEDISLLLRPGGWDSKFRSLMKDLGYIDSKIHPVYIEYHLRDNFKMQFLSTEDRTQTPYKKVTLWEMEIQIESVEEIIAKKIYYRAHKGNARDLFDIAVAIHKDPTILNKLHIPVEKIEELLYTLNLLLNDMDLAEEFHYEIELMNPNPKYSKLSLHCIKYLQSFIESYLGAKNLGIELDDSELVEIEKYSYNDSF